MTKRRWLGSAAAIGFGALVLLVVLADRGDFSEPLVDRGGSLKPVDGSVDPTRDPVASHSHPSTPTRADRVAIAVPDPETMRWNAMAPAERINELAESFRQAINDLQSGREVDRNLEIAEAALTALRSELYASPAGRKRHQDMEAELDEIVRRRRAPSHPQDEP